ncbi:hypothetical protein BC477_00140 [Clavibacter michiganensis subsp. michiganensis]|uniref:Uncharacterized protein n=1 Tax=Clavibacter michiganensis subsp. michiganensis TaxID=33013 RepID=A0A251XFC9_CLAMM|nr:hypothetical protein BC477_00140 [Clavibacter michiganensis subsp. michiganensis]OUE01017.1 hypothetical protein CMMCAS07_16375 [Clavibacter michiganensis subsp. michiganensis]
MADQSAMRLSARSSARRTMDRPALCRPVRVLTPREVLDAVWKRRSRPVLVVPPVRAPSSARRTWPAISPSPTTTDSRPEETAKRCSATASPHFTSTLPRTSSRAMPLAPLTTSTVASTASARPL